MARAKEELAHVVRTTGEVRRSSDPDDADFRYVREPLKDSNGIDVGYKGVHLNLRGPVAMLTVCCALIGGVLCYVNYMGFKETKELLSVSIQDHRHLIEGQDLLACVISLTPEERQRVRMQPTRDGYQLFCPWLRLDGIRDLRPR